MKLAAPFVLLEDRLDPLAEVRLYQRPEEIVRCDRRDAVGEAFARIEAGLARGLHAAGFLAYDLGFALEPRLAPLMPAHRSGPLLWMGLFPPPRRIPAREADAMFAALGAPPPITDLTPNHDRATHMAKVECVLELIRAGDIYQANLTFPIRFRYGGDPLALYGVLRVRQPVAHGGVMVFEDAAVLSVSPELFLDVTDGQLTSRPMKGTAARLAGPGADAAAVRALAADPKQRAENLMIVDLLRNDLARIAEPGSVQAPRLFATESYPSFHALTSTVTARLRPGLGLLAQIAAVFPCGSIVGAPKIRAAEILAGLEESPRGVYTGALGAFTPGGDLHLNVAIRTAVIDRNGCGTYGVGGGVVADSDPGAEYDEALLKARVLEGLADDYGLIETFGWSSQHGFVRLPRHLDRLARSASELGFLFDRAAAQARLAALALGWAATAQDRRVRLLLSRTGELEITDAPAPETDTRPVRLAVAAERLDAGDPFLRHKTTHRDAYDRAFAEARAAGCDEALLLNRFGEVADGARHSVFAQLGDRMVTPPLGSGALPGVLRSVLLDDGRAVESPLTLDALSRAAAIFVGNSFRGLRRARIV